MPRRTLAFPNLVVLAAAICGSQLSAQSPERVHLPAYYPGHTGPIAVFGGIENARDVPTAPQPVSAVFVPPQRIAPVAEGTQRVEIRRVEVQRDGERPVSNRSETDPPRPSEAAELQRTRAQIAPREQTEPRREGDTGRRPVLRATPPPNPNRPNNARPDSPNSDRRNPPTQPDRRGPDMQRRDGPGIDQPHGPQAERRRGPEGEHRDRPDTDKRDGPDAVRRGPPDMFRGGPPQWREGTGPGPRLEFRRIELPRDDDDEEELLDRAEGFDRLLSSGIVKQLLKLTEEKLRLEAELRIAQAKFESEMRVRELEMERHMERAERMVADARRAEENMERERQEMRRAQEQAERSQVEAREMLEQAERREMERREMERREMERRRDSEGANAKRTTGAEEVERLQRTLQQTLEAFSKQQAKPSGSVYYQRAKPAEPARSAEAAALELRQKLEAAAKGNAELEHRARLMEAKMQEMAKQLELAKRAIAEAKVQAGRKGAQANDDKDHGDKDHGDKDHGDKDHDDRDDEKKESKKKSDRNRDK